MSLKCLVFDCDGVILDSVPTKTRAFARLAEPYGDEARDMMVMYHKTHGGVSRYLKFAWFFREVLGREITEEESRKWGELFSEYALDEEELRSVLALRNLAPYFDLVLGSPPVKAQVWANIVNEFGLDPADVLMVGDSSTDRDAAEQVGTLFYGCGPELKNDGLFPWGETLSGLDDWIAAHV